MSRYTEFPTRLYVNPAAKTQTDQTLCSQSRDVLDSSRPTHKVFRGDTDQTALMQRLICVFAGLTHNRVGNARLK